LGENGSNYVSADPSNIELKFNDEILDVFVDYVTSEYESVKQELSRIQLENENDGKVSNLDSGTKITVNKIVEVVEDGKTVKKTIS